MHNLFQISSGIKGHLGEEIFVIIFRLSGETGLTALRWYMFIVRILQDLI